MLISEILLVAHILSLKKSMLPLLTGRQVCKVVVCGVFATEETSKVVDPLGWMLKDEHYITDFNDRYDPKTKTFKEISKEESAEALAGKLSLLGELTDGYAELQTIKDEAFIADMAEVMPGMDFFGKQVEAVAVWKPHYYTALAGLAQKYLVSERSSVRSSITSSSQPYLPIFSMAMHKRYGLEVTRDQQLRTLLEVLVAPHVYRRTGRYLKNTNAEMSVLAYVMNAPSPDDLEELCIAVDRTGSATPFRKYLLGMGIDLDIRSTVQNIAQYAHPRKKNGENANTFGKW